MCDNFVCMLNSNLNDVLNTERGYVGIGTITTTTGSVTITDYSRFESVFLGITDSQGGINEVTIPIGLLSTAAQFWQLFTFTNPSTYLSFTIRVVISGTSIIVTGISIQNAVNTLTRVNVGAWRKTIKLSQNIV